MELWFDRYDMKARLVPGVIVIMPVFFGAMILFPVMKDLFQNVLGVAVLLAISILSATIIRDLGKKKEKDLFLKFGGIPTIKLLRHSDSEIDHVTKARYHSYLTSKANIVMPTKEEELANLNEADKKYASAINWLRQKNRGNEFILNYNISYGFARNLWGSKLYGIILCILSLAGTAAIINHRFGFDYTKLPVEVWWYIAFDIIIIFLWFAVITPSWVYAKSKLYARALLETCDSEN